MDTSNAWDFLFEQIRKLEIEKSSGLPDAWAWSTSRGPADHNRIQMRKELVAAGLEGGKVVTTRSKHTLRRVSIFIPPTDDEIKAARVLRYGEQKDDADDGSIFKSQISCDSRGHLSNDYRCRAAFSSGCVPFHGIPIRLPEKKERSLFSPRDSHQRSTDVFGELNVPRKYKRWVSSRNPSVDDIPEVSLDESMRVATAKEIDSKRKRELAARLAQKPDSKDPKRRDAGMAAALQKVVAKHRSSLKKKMPPPKIVMLDLDAERQQEVLDHITVIQRAFRRKIMNKDELDMPPDPENFDPRRHRPARQITAEEVRELQQEKKELDRERERKKPPPSWTKLLAMREKRDKASELPLPGVDEVWDVITRRYGGVRSHATIVDVVDLFHGCKLAGLNMDLAQFPGLWPAREVVPEDVSPGEVAHLCIMLLEDPAEKLTFAQVRAALDCVKEECRATAHKDLYIGNDDEHEYIKFSHFKRLLHFLGDLMAIDEQYILGTFMYLCTGTFEMPDLFAALVMKEMGKKHKWKAKKDNHRPDSQETAPKKKKKDKAKPHAPFVGCAIEDIESLLNQKFSSVDFSRMCYNCQILDSRNGVTFARCGEAFLQTARHMGKLMKDRVAKRPILHQDSEKWEDMMLKYAAPSLIFASSLDDKNIACCFTIGRSEFCVLMEALHMILPKSWFGGPLDMCMKLLLKIRAREEDRARGVVRSTSKQLSPSAPPLPHVPSKDTIFSTESRIVRENRSRSPSVQGRNTEARRRNRSSSRSSVSSRQSSKSRSASTTRNKSTRLEVP